VRKLVLFWILGLSLCAQAQNWKDMKRLATVQKICVDQPQRDLKAELEQKLGDRGHRVVHCDENYDASLYMFVLSWSGYTGEFGFMVQTVEVGNTVLGSAYVYPRTASGRSWVVTLAPRDSIFTIYRDQGCETVDCGLKHLDKALRKAKQKRRG
jgi:hypothetical protein